MRRSILSLGLVSLSLCVLAQSRSSPKNNEDLIQHVKNLLASSFDGRLPRVSLDYFLAYETDGAAAKWTATKCDSAAPGVPHGHDFPICVAADFDLNDGGVLTILTRVEGAQNEKFGNASLVSLTVTKSTGTVRQIRSLSDLPMELHRWPSRTAKDLPLPVRDS